MAGWRRKLSEAYDAGQAWIVVSLIGRYRRDSQHRDAGGGRGVEEVYRPLPRADVGLLRGESLTIESLMHQRGYCMTGLGIFG